MKVGIFGGTFNPVHCGHVLLAQAYMRGAGLDKLLVIPARTPPHKAAPDLADGMHRMEMCRLAFASLPGSEVSDIELARPKTSFTVDTLELLYRMHPEDRLCLLMGSDMFLTMTQWREWRRIFELAEICVGARENALDTTLMREKRRLEALGARCVIVSLEPLEISSTQVREQLAQGKSIAGMVPETVEQYLIEHRLYQK